MSSVFNAPITTNKEFLTPEEAAELMRVSTRTVYEMLRNGKLPAAQVGRQWRIRTSDILPSNVGQLFQEALELDAQGSTELALFRLEQVIKSHPYYGLAYWLLGTLAGRSERHHKAIEYLEKAIALNPEYKQAYHNLGVAYNEIGSSEGIPALEKAIELDPSYTNTYYQLGVAYNLGRRFQDAARTLEEAIKRDPRGTMAYHFLAFAYERLDQHELARQTRERASKLLAEQGK